MYGLGFLGFRDLGFRVLGFTQGFRGLGVQGVVLRIWGSEV